MKETEGKFDRLVNAFLDGTVDRETHLAKKDELITTKVTLQEKKDAMRRTGHHWIEPLRAWINATRQAENLASSQDLYQIKAFIETIGTNRLLLGRRVSWAWAGAWRILASARENVVAGPPMRARVVASQTAQRLDWSALYEKIRTELRGCG